MSLTNSGNKTKLWSRRQGTLALNFTGYLLSAVTVVQGVVLVPLYLHYIDKLLYGAWLSTGAIISYFFLMDFGLNTVIMQKVAGAYGAGDIAKLSRYLGSSLVLGLCFSLFAALIGVVFAPYLLRLIPIPDGMVQTLEAAFRIAVCTVAVTIGGCTFGVILCAFQRQLLHGVIWVGASITGLTCTVVLLLSGYGLKALPLGSLVQAGLILAVEGFFF
jgi:O-antigen/teichoic acid export membrane protein